MNSTPARMDRILCPTDFSAFSVQSLAHAVTLARTSHARVKVVHVIANIGPGVESVYGGAPWLLSDDDRRRIDEEMRGFVQPLREAGVDHEVEIREGEPWREIAAAAAQMQADLVVLGTHGRGGLNHLFLGSVAEKLIRKLPTPVLTVRHEDARPSEAPRDPLARILCATDFSEMSREALRMAAGLALEHQSALTLLHVVEDMPDLSAAAHRGLVDMDVLRQALERSALERLLKLEADLGIKEIRIEPRAVVGVAYKEILRVASLERADLIVIGAQGHGFLEHLLSGSNAQHVIRRAPCPVLTVRRVGVRDEGRKAAAAVGVAAERIDHDEGQGGER